MGDCKVFRVIVAFSFLLEVINPSTAFVREQAASLAHQASQVHQKITQSQKVVQDMQDPVESSQTDSSENELIYPHASAIIPAVTLPVLPHSARYSFASLMDAAPQALIGSVHRPPSRS